MTNPTTAELVEIIRCIAGKLQGVDQYDSLAVYAAADRLEKLEAELSACISDMTAYVQRKIRDECDLCKRSAPREFCREVDYCCALCNHTAGCVCAWCRACDQFKWRGVPLPEPPKEEQHESECVPRGN